MIDHSILATSRLYQRETNQKSNHDVFVKCVNAVSDKNRFEVNLILVNKVNLIDEPHQSIVSELRKIIK